MKIIVISDSHGSINSALEILKAQDYDLIIHLGDNSEDARKIQDKLKQEIIFVRGNCDYYNLDASLEKVIEIEGKKIFISHGHEYGVKSSLDRIYYRGRELGADLVLFGHTHLAYIDKSDIILFNPGSISLPKPGKKASYGIIEIHKDGIRTKLKEI